MSEQIREILTDEQDQIALATALGQSVPAQRREAIFRQQVK
jgi:hypothetical protein